jgi:hypothetical protein
VACECQRDGSATEWVRARHLWQKVKMSRHESVQIKGQVYAEVLGGEMACRRVIDYGVDTWEFPLGRTRCLREALPFRFSDLQFEVLQCDRTLGYSCQGFSYYKGN